MGFDYASKIRSLLEAADGQERSAEKYDTEASSLSGDRRDEMTERAAAFREGAQSFRNKAFQLMRDYQIAHEEMLASDPRMEAPTSLTVEYKPTDFMLAGYYDMMAHRIATHIGCMVHTQRGEDYVTRRVTVVGYEGDVKYWEFLWTSAHLMFATRIDPRWDSSLSDAENVYRMRQAGIKRREIADAAGWDGSNAASRSRVQRVYVKEAATRGEAAAASGLGFDSKNYRESYADAFVTRLTRRMREARDAADAAGGALILSGREDRIREAFYDLFPRLRPSTEAATPWVDPRTTCPKKACREGRWCTDHMYLKPRTWGAADEARYQRRQNSSSAQAGRQSGRAAADGVVLRGTSARTDRIDSGTRALEG